MPTLYSYENKANHGDLFHCFLLFQFPCKSSLASSESNDILKAKDKGVSIFLISKVSHFHLKSFVFKNVAKWFCTKLSKLEISLLVLTGLVHAHLDMTHSTKRKHWKVAWMRDRNVPLCQSQQVLLTASSRQPCFHLVIYNLAEMSQFLLAVNQNVWLATLCTPCSFQLTDALLH